MIKPQKLTFSYLIGMLMSLAPIAGLASKAEPPKSPDVDWTYSFPGQTWGESTLNSGLLYLGCDDGNCYSFDIENQRIHWSFNTQGSVRSKPLIVEDKIYFNSDDGYLYCLNRETGDFIWKKLIDMKPTRRLPAFEGPYDYDYLVSSPIYWNKTIFIGSASGKLYAIDEKPGDTKWKFKTNGRIRSTPAVTTNTVIIGSWDHAVYALDSKSGKLKWKFNTAGILNSTPVVDSKNVYIGSRDTHLYAIDQASGQLVWKHLYEDGSWADSSGIVHNNQLYFGSSDALKLSAFDTENGDELWHFKTEGWTWSQPYINDETIYIGGISAFPYYFEGITLKNGLFAVDLKTRKLHWKLPAPQIEAYITGGYFTQPVLFVDKIYVTSIDGTLFCIRKP